MLKHITENVYCMRHALLSHVSRAVSSGTQCLDWESSLCLLHQGAWIFRYIWAAGILGLKVYTISPQLCNLFAFAYISAIFSLLFHFFAFFCFLTQSISLKIPLPKNTMIFTLGKFKEQLFRFLSL